MSNITDTVALGERPTTGAEKAAAMRLVSRQPGADQIAQTLGLTPTPPAPGERIRRGLESGAMVKTSEAARILGVSDRTLRASRCKYPPTVGRDPKNGRDRVWARADLVAWDD